MRTAKVFQQGNSQAVRWQHLKACLGKFRGVLERPSQGVFEERDWPR